MKERRERSAHDGRRCVLVKRLCLDVLHGSFSEGHRWSILVSQPPLQTLLDAGRSDRCDVVEICCTDSLCLVDAMRQRGLSSTVLSRAEGIEKL